MKVAGGGAGFEPQPKAAAAARAVGQAGPAAGDGRGSASWEGMRSDT